MSEFEPFTDKGGRYVTQKTASVSMNHHGNVNIPGSVHEDIFDGGRYVEYLLDEANGRLGFRVYQADADNVPDHAYVIQEDAPSASVEKPLAALGKRPPDEHTMFELRHDGESGVPYINVSKLPDVDGDSDE